MCEANLAVRKNYFLLLVVVKKLLRRRAKHFVNFVYLILLALSLEERLERYNFIEHATYAPNIDLGVRKS